MLSAEQAADLVEKLASHIDQLDHQQIGAWELRGRRLVRECRAQLNCMPPETTGTPTHSLDHILDHPFPHNDVLAGLYQLWHKLPACNLLALIGNAIQELQAFRSDEARVMLSITIEQADALSQALDSFVRLTLAQLQEIPELVAQGIIPAKPGSTNSCRPTPSPEVTDEIRSLIGAVRAILGYAGGESLGLGPHVPLAGLRAYETQKVLSKVLAEHRNPTPEFRGVNYDGLTLRYTKDPVPMAFVTPRPHNDSE